MQAGETKVLEAAIPRLRAIGWGFVAPIGDALVLEALPPSASGPEAAREEMEATAHELGMPLMRVKIAHMPIGS